MDKIYALGGDSNSALKVAWSRINKDTVEVKFDGGNSLIVDGLGSYENGKEVLLTNGKKILLRLVGGRLSVDYQGRELSGAYPCKYLISATLIVLGALFIIAGLLGNFMPELPLGGFGFSTFTGMAGAAFLLAAWLVNKEQNWAVGAAILVLLAERSQAAVSVYGHGRWPAMPLAALVLLGALLVLELRAARRRPA